MSEKEKESEKKDKKNNGEEEKSEETPQEKKAKTVRFIIFAGILVVIFLGVVLIPKLIQNTNLEKYKYNEFTFVKRNDGLWYVYVQKGAQPYWIPFYYHPSELEDIPVEQFLREKFFEIRDNNGSIFITLDPDSENNTVVIAGVEISRITGGRYDLLNVPTRSAFVKQPTGGSAETNTPVVTCMNSNNKTLVIWLTISDKTVISTRGYPYCIVVEARNYKDMVRAADRLMYHLLGIMD